MIETVRRILKRMDIDGTKKKEFDPRSNGCRTGNGRKRSCAVIVRRRDVGPVVGQVFHKVRFGATSVQYRRNRRRNPSSRVSRRSCITQRESRHEWSRARRTATPLGFPVQRVDPRSWWGCRLRGTHRYPSAERRRSTPE